MLKRIRKIQNVGRFVDSSSSGCEMKGETIVFGFNTQGKSTLTAILRSIQSGNSDLLIGRKSFGVAGNAQVEIDFVSNGANDPYVFNGKSWNKTNSNILIFDAKFIAENISDGENITFDQQKNLNMILIGKKGQELSKEITDLQKLGEDFAKQKADKTREFSAHFPGVNFVEFHSIVKDNDIEDKLVNIAKKIKFESEKEAIKKAVKAHIQTLTDIRFTIKDTLSRTLDVKQEEIETHIKLHLKTSDNAQNFLRDGLVFQKDQSSDESPRVCAFCGQALGANAEALISIYSAYFKGGYKELQRDIDAAIKYFRELNIEAILEKIAVSAKENEFELELDEAKIALLVGLKKQFESELLRKSDLNYSVNFDAFDKLQGALDELVTKLKHLDEVELNIVAAKPVSTLQEEKRNLDLIKKRHETVWIKFCNDWDSLEDSAEEVRRQRELKRVELDQYSATIFGTHKTTINTLCKDMGADFEIEDFKPLRKIVGRDERIFAINFFGRHKVSIDNQEEKTPNFHNTLSESDKRLLAFAFFISLLLHDRELANKIVLFDDPVSSFDIERRRKTVQIISDIACSYKDDEGVTKVVLPDQKIILTHEDRFAKKLVEMMPNAQSLKIEEYVESGEKRSRIVHANFNEDFPDDDIAYRIENVEKILANRLFNIPFETDCRVILENVFKRKYHRYLKEEIAAKKSIRTFSVKLSSVRVGQFEMEQKFKAFIRLCDYLNIELHDTSTSNSNGDKESVLKDFFKCLEII